MSGSLVGRLRRWMWSVFTCCSTEFQPPSHCHSSLAHGPPNPAPTGSLTNLIKTRASNLIREDTEMNSNPLPTEECTVDHQRWKTSKEDSIHEAEVKNADIYNGETEFLDLVFLKSDTHRIAKIIPIDLDKDSDSHEKPDDCESILRISKEDVNGEPENVLNGGSACVQAADQQMINPGKEATGIQSGAADTQMSASRVPNRGCPGELSFAWLASLSELIPDAGSGRLMVHSSFSSDYSRRDDNSGQIEFPRLVWEWVGSPARMPSAAPKRDRKHWGSSTSRICFR